MILDIPLRQCNCIGAMPKEYVEKMNEINEEVFEQLVKNRFR